MTVQPDVDKLIRQTRQYEFADGLRDLQMAVILGLGGIAVWLAFEPFWWAFAANLAKGWGGRWAVWLNMLPVILAPLAAWGMLRLMGFLRQRWLWRESGIVKPSRGIVPRRVNILSTVIVLGGIALGFGLHLLGQVDAVFVWRMLWAATGWALGHTLIGVGRHLDLARYVWLGVIGGVASTFLLFLPFTFGQTALVFGLSWCLLLAGSGTIVLRRAFHSVQRGN